MRYQLHYRNVSTGNVGDFEFACLCECYKKAYRLHRIPQAQVFIVDTLLNRKMTWTGNRRWYDI